MICLTIELLETYGVDIDEKDEDQTAVDGAWEMNLQRGVTCDQRSWQELGPGHGLNLSNDSKGQRVEPALGPGGP